MRPGVAVLAAGALLALGAVATPAGADDVTYRAQCAVCHGDRGTGDGPAAPMLSPRPRDFTRGVYKFRSTPSGTLPTPADVAAVIRDGLRGTSMPAYRGLLDETTIARLAQYVLALAPPGAKRAAPIDRDVAAGGRNPAGAPESAVASGRALYERARCGACHGGDGRGVAPATSRERPRDLTEPWTFRTGAASDVVALRIRSGIDGSGMPGYHQSLSPEEARAVAEYVATLARRPAWDEPDPAAITRAGVATDRVERGRYLVNAMLCPLCHTPISATDGAYDSRYFLAGGMRVTAWPWGAWYSRNLTPDRATGLGAWSEDDIVRAVTDGVRPDGRRLDPMAMPWPWFRALTASDARAVAAYLKSLPPIANAVPAPVKPTLVERSGGKLLALFGLETAVEFWGGNAASDSARRDGVPVSDRRRRAAQATGWATLLACVGLPLLAGSRRRRHVVTMTAGALGLAGWLMLAVWPPFALMSPPVLAQWLFRGTPGVPATLPPREQALARRGEYVATIAPCGLCHTPAGAFLGFYTDRTLAGGMEGRWRVYGSAVSTNLTPAGVRGDFLRSLRSGIAADGRRMHWQAMPWDILSNWSEEDLRALQTYLDALPGVPGKAPPPRPPKPDDPEADAFYFGDAAIR